MNAPVCHAFDPLAGEVHWTPQSSTDPVEEAGVREHIVGRLSVKSWEAAKKEPAAGPCQCVGSRLTAYVAFGAPCLTDCTDCFSRKHCEGFFRKIL